MTTQELDIMNNEENKSIIRKGSYKLSPGEFAVIDTYRKRITSWIPNSNSQSFCRFFGEFQDDMFKSNIYDLFFSFLLDNKIEGRDTTSHQASPGSNPRHQRAKEICPAKVPRWATARAPTLTIWTLQWLGEVDSVWPQYEVAYNYCVG